MVQVRRFLLKLDQFANMLKGIRCLLLLLINVIIVLIGLKVRLIMK